MQTGRFLAQATLTGLSSNGTSGTPACLSAGGRSLGLAPPALSPGQRAAL